MRLAALALVLAVLGLVRSEAAARMVVIGIDGLSPDGVRKAQAPNMKRLMERGAWTLHARGVFPTSSSPNWASMIMGATPEIHGVTSNEWQTNKFEIPPVVTGSGGMFPTIFGVLREQRPRLRMGVFHDWNDFGRLFERQAVDLIEDADGPTNAVRQAIAYWRSTRPDFTFIHMDHVDHAGHHDGHGSQAYYDAVDVADKLIGEALAGLDAAGMQNAYILITADHGGVGTKHGNMTMPELEIPWILAGPKVKHGHEIRAPVNTFDTAATVARIFEVRPPAVWIGRPVSEAFR